MTDETAPPDPSNRPSHPGWVKPETPSAKNWQDGFSNEVSLGDVTDEYRTDILAKLDARREEKRREDMNRRRRETRQRRAARIEPPAPVGPRRGRPAWTDDVFLDHWAEAIAATSRPRTFESIGANFRPLNSPPGGETGVDTDHLADLYRKHGSPSFE